jgi:hypothetical protein
MGRIEWFVVDDEGGLASLRDEWRRLATVSADPSLFSASEWKEADQTRLLLAPGEEALGPDRARVAVEDRLWAWAHPAWSRPIRRLKRSLHGLVPGVA